MSQPMVSIYCKSNKKVNSELVETAQKISNLILEGNIVNFQTCVNFSKKDFKGKFFVAEKNEILADENIRILENLKKAFNNIKEKNLSVLIPKIKINIAMSKKNPKNSEDIASFLDGLVVADKKITGYNGIRFGKSQHLSSILLNHGKNLRKNAVMNIAYIKKLKNTNFQIGYLTKNFDLKQVKSDYDILVHEGDFGIEPCAYVLGKDAYDVSNKILVILGEINNGK